MTAQDHTIILHRSPQGPTAVESMLDMMQEMQLRQRRIETRLVRLMIHHELDASGHPQGQTDSLSECQPPKDFQYDPAHLF